MGRNELTPQEIYLRKIISNNIASLCKINNVTQTYLSKKLNIPKSTLNGYYNGTSLPNPVNAQKLADFFGVKKSDIDPRFKQDPTNIIEIKQTRNIPVIGTIACGEPILAQENVSDTIPFPVELLPSSNLFFLKVQGNSMEPTIKEDALVLIRKQEEVENGKIAAVLVNGDTEATLKKVRKIDDTILLEAINEEYAPYLVNKENPARIIGRAIKVLNEL